MSYTISDAREDLIPQIQRIEQQSFSVPWTEQMLRVQLSPDSHVFLTAQTEDGVVGYIGILTAAPRRSLKSFSSLLPK